MAPLAMMPLGPYCHKDDVGTGGVGSPGVGQVVWILSAGSQESKVGEEG